MLKAVLVDFDGTLVDTTRANAEAYAQALTEAGLLITADVLIPLIHGRSWRDFLPPMLPAASDSTLHTIVERKRTIYPQYFHATTPNSVLLELLQKWKGTYAIALVTTASRASVAPLLKYHHLTGLFDTIVCGEDVTQNKPSPEAFHKAAAHLHVELDECLIIEDSNTGIAAAQAFGGHLLRWVSPIA